MCVIPPLLLLLFKKKKRQLSKFKHLHCHYFIMSESLALCSPDPLLPGSKCSFLFTVFIPFFFPPTPDNESPSSVWQSPRGLVDNYFRLSTFMEEQRRSTKNFITHLLLEWKPNTVWAFLAVGTGKPWTIMASTAVLCGP